MQRTPVEFLYLIAEPNAAENAVFDLATVIHEQAETGRRVVSWAAQVEADAYITAYGVEAALLRIAAWEAR